MLVHRSIVDHLQELSRYFPIVSLTGPRQAGKTTLLKHLFAGYRYVSLEDPDQRLRATVKELIFGGEESFTARSVAVNAWFR